MTKLRSLVGTLLALALIASYHQLGANALKKETKKIAKAVVKNIVWRKLTTQHRIFPVPVPLPVPIEINEPPEYHNGPPKYVTVYKKLPYTATTSAVVAKPVSYKSYSSYNLPEEKNSEKYPQEQELSEEKYQSSRDKESEYAAYAPELTRPASAEIGAINYDDSPSQDLKKKFADFDDDYYSPSTAIEKEKQLAYHLRRSALIRQQRAEEFALAAAADSDDLEAAASEQESEHYEHPIFSPAAILPHPSDAQHHQLVHLVRIKRSAPYLPPPPPPRAAYEKEEPCFGFPLEINVKSRIKPEDVFPIRGKSQFKKCIRLDTRPPPIPPHTHIRMNFKPTPRPYYPSKEY